MPCRTAFSIGDKVRVIEIAPGQNITVPAFVGQIGTIKEVHFYQNGVSFHIFVEKPTCIVIEATKVGRIPKPMSRKPLTEGVKPDAPKEAPPVSSESVPAPAGFGPAGVPHTSTATGNGIVAQRPAGAVD